MALLKQHLEHINFQDKHFVGAVTFKNEEIALPDGSKMALGIDDGHWVLIYEKPPKQQLKVFRYDNHEKKLVVDQKNGSPEDMKVFKGYLDYFFSHVRTEDLITLLPPGAQT